MVIITKGISDVSPLHFCDTMNIFKDVGFREPQGGSKRLEKFHTIEQACVKVKLGDWGFAC